MVYGPSVKTKTLLKSALLFSSLAGLLLVSACGYQFIGRASGLPPEIRKIAVPTFDNNTFEPLLEERLTEAVKSGLMVRPRFEVVNNASEADAVFKGKINFFSLIPLSFTPDNIAAEYRVRILADFTLQNTRDQKILWQEKMRETTADYFVIQDPLSTTAQVDIARTRDAEDRAIAEAAKVLADSLVGEILEGFPSR
jgi:hypothetical protein